MKSVTSQLVTKLSQISIWNFSIVFWAKKIYAAAQLSLAQELDSLHFGLSFEFLGVAQFVLLLKTLNSSDALAH